MLVEEQSWNRKPYDLLVKGEYHISICNEIEWLRVGDGCTVFFGTEAQVTQRKARDADQEYEIWGHATHVSYCGFGVVIRQRHTHGERVRWADVPADIQNWLREYAPNWCTQ